MKAQSTGTVCVRNVFSRFYASISLYLMVLKRNSYIAGVTVYFSPHSQRLQRKRKKKRCICILTYGNNPSGKYGLLNFENEDLKAS